MIDLALKMCLPTGSPFLLKNPRQDKSAKLADVKTDQTAFYADKSSELSFYFLVYSYDFYEGFASTDRSFNVCLRVNITRTTVGQLVRQDDFLVRCKLKSLFISKRCGSG